MSPSSILVMANEKLLVITEIAVVLVAFCRQLVPHFKEIILVAGLAAIIPYC